MAKNTRWTNETKSAPEDFDKAARIRSQVEETRKYGAITSKGATVCQKASGSDKSSGKK